MFTGIVEGKAELVSMKEQDGFTRWVVDLPPNHGQNLEIGASVALDGVCLTVIGIDGDSVSFDLIQETLNRTTLCDRETGDWLNMERALRYGDEVGGHLVSGHIMAVGKITRIDASEQDNSGSKTLDIEIHVPLQVSEYVFEKGYIAIDGISLTVGKTHKSGGFNLHIIPETIRRTTLAEKEVGSTVNVEIESTTQAVVDTVKKMLAGNPLLGLGKSEPTSEQKGGI
ncbi:MAG: riboflavin synthase [Euryarchaeota archaeon]|nr:riboflavin synthase [Euryarchaeota archaeon]|tara:strand:+ start:970 stop:1650 length:681 start_codon:yes stop_codon:yes gene_type:complete